MGGESPCQPVWRSDGRVLDHCRCGNYDPSVCQVRVSDVLQLKPSQVGREAGIDSQGRWCSGGCPANAKARCSGTWGQRQGQDVLLSCECEQADGCRVDPGDGEEGSGICSGFCANDVVTANSGTAMFAVSLVEHEVAPCRPTYDGEFMVSCTCRPDDPEETGCRRVVSADGQVNCEGVCKETGKNCDWSEDEYGRKMCGCPPPQEPEECHIDAKYNICVGGCGDSSVCLPRYYQSSSMLMSTTTPQLIGCDCAALVEPGCKLAEILDPKTETSTTTCVGNCKATGSLCAFRQVGKAQVCGCSDGDGGDEGKCRLDQQANACLGLSECPGVDGKLVKCQPTEVAVHPKLGTKVLQCGCPARPLPKDRCIIEKNRCYGKLAGNFLECVGTYTRGKLDGCGRLPQDTTVVCKAANMVGSCTVRPLARELGLKERPRMEMVYEGQAAMGMPGAVVAVEFDGDDEDLRGLHVTMLPSPVPTCDQSLEGKDIFGGACVPPVAGTVVDPALHGPPKLVPLGVGFALIATHTADETVAPDARPKLPMNVGVQLAAPLTGRGRLVMLALSQALATDGKTPPESAWVLPSGPGAEGLCAETRPKYDYKRGQLVLSVCAFTQYALFWVV